MAKTNVSDWFDKKLIYEKELWNDGEHRIVRRKWEHLDKNGENSYHQTATVYEIEFYIKSTDSWNLSARRKNYKEAVAYLGF